MFTEVERISNVAMDFQLLCAVAVLAQCGGTMVGRINCVTGVCCETGWSCVYAGL